MEELRLVGVLILSLLIQLILIPFRIIAWIFSVVEKFGRVIKETVKHFIKMVQSEVSK